jgi:hypothetical protein
MTDGERVFVGVFRPDFDAMVAGGRDSGATVWICTCGVSLYTLPALRTHWQQGCFDKPIYRTVEEVVRMRAEAT